MSTSFEEILDRDGMLVYKTRGQSMQPMLYEERDIVIIEKPKARYKKFDVVLFNTSNKYLLHRVIKDKGSYFITRGDNNEFVEKVPEDAILGVLTGFTRDGKEYKVTDPEYVAYYKKRVLLYPLRFVYRKLRGFAGKIKRKLKK